MRITPLPAIGGLWGLFILLGLLGVLHHEIWFDEAHTWLLARDSHSWVELFRNARADRQPLLWHCLLYILKHISTKPLAMQLLHWIIASLAAGIFLHKGPFPYWFKVLLIFGYFILFEYTLIARNYGPGMLFLFAFCFLYQKNAPPIWIGLLLGLLANTHPLGLVAGAGLCIWWFLDLDKRRAKRFFQGQFLAATGFALAILPTLWAWQSMPGVVQERARPFNLETAGKSFLIIWRAFIPIPNIGNYHFWPTNWIVDDVRSVAVIGAGALFLLPLLFFRKDVKALVFFYYMLFAVMFLCHFFNAYAPRYYGYIFMTFIVCLWLANYFGREQKSIFQRGVLIFLMICQMIGGIIAYSIDWRRPFSEGLHAAQFIQEKGLEKEIIVSEFCFGMTLNAYLDKSLYYPDLQRKASYCEWEVFAGGLLAYRDSVDYYSRLIRGLSPLPQENFVLAQYHPLDSLNQPLRRSWEGSNYELTIAPLATFDKSTSGMENYYLYYLKLVKKDRISRD